MEGEIPIQMFRRLALVAWFVTSHAACTPSERPTQTKRDAAWDRFNRPLRCQPVDAAGPEPVLEEQVVRTGLDGSLGGVALDIGFVDSDAIPDLLVASSLSNAPHIPAPTRMTILRGKGGRELEAAGNAKEVGSGTSAFLADINADGRHDVVNGEYVSLATTSGRLSAPKSLKGGEAGRPIWGSVNGDDFVDLIVGTQTELHVRLGGASGLSDEVTVIRHAIPLLWNRMYVNLQDIDGDGFDDLVLVDQKVDDSDSYPPAVIEVWRNEGGERFSLSAERLEIERGLSTTSVAYGDFNCDGQLDLVTVNPKERIVEVYLYAGEGWKLETSLTIGDPSAFVGAGGTLAVGDLNGDGAQDLVVASIVVVEGAQGVEFLGEIEVFVGDGSGSFGEPLVLKSSKVKDFLPQPLVVGDLDGNGLDDIVVLMLETDDFAVAWFADEPGS